MLIYSLGFIQNMNSTISKAIDQFEKCGGIMRTSEILSAGIHPLALYEMRDKEEVFELSRGVFGNFHLISYEKSIKTSKSCQMILSIIKSKLL